jgi:preprotein translocase subunit SecY
MAGTLLCVVQATGIALFLERQSKILGGLRLVYSPGWTFRLTTVLTLTAGSAALMWLGDYITERRTGNGLFLMFLAGMLVGLPGIVGAAWWDPYRTMRSLTVLAMIVGVAASGYRRAIQSASLA